jgi:hypothetical protein
MTYQTTHENPLWSYFDGRGVERTGHFAHFTDRGGTDVTYYFRDCATGELSLVSGSRLKASKRLWHSCGKCGRVETR